MIAPYRHTLRPDARRVLLALALALALLVMAASARAEPFRRVGQNPRGLALGGTGVSYADDEMGLFYNPAGLGGIDN